MAILGMFLFMRRKLSGLQRDNAVIVQYGEAENIQEIAVDDEVSESGHSISVEKDGRAEGVVVEAGRATQAMETMQEIGDV